MPPLNESLCPLFPGNNQFECSFRREVMDGGGTVCLDKGWCLWSAPSLNAMMGEQDFLLFGSSEKCVVVRVMVL